MPNRLRTNLALAATVLALAAASRAQTAPPPEKPAEPTPKVQPAKAPLSAAEAHQLAIRHRDTSLDTLRTYRLPAGQPNDGNEVLTGLRLMLDPSSKLYLVPSQNTIMLRTYPEEFALADQIVRETTRTKPNYRLTYSVAESDNGKRLGVQHFSINLVAGARSTLKDGSKIYVATSSSQFSTYDVGMSFDVTLLDGADGMHLLSKVEQSSLEEVKPVNGQNLPLIRQSTLEGTSLILPGKPVMLGSLDIPASTRHQDVEVLLELVK